MTIDVRPRTFGENLALVFQLTVRHFFALLMIQAVCALPNLALQIWIYSSLLTGPPDSTVAPIVAGFGGMVLSLLLQIIASAVCTLVVANSFMLRRIGIGAAVGEAIRRLPSLLGFALILGAILIAAGIAGVLPFALIDMALGTAGFVFIGVALAVGVAALVFVSLYVGQCSIVLEGRSAGNAVSRSMELTRGRRWMIVGIILVCGLIGWIAQSVTQVIIVGVFSASAGALSDTTAISIMMFMTWFVSIVAWLLLVVAPIVVYFSVRAEKDGFDVEELASLVDEIGRRGAAADGI